MALAQSQYGGDRAPAISPAAGGASVVSGLASAAFGMFTGGIGPAATELAKAAGDSSTTTISPSVKTTQSTGSKVFNLPGASDAFAANDYWTKAVSGPGIVGIAVVVGLVLLIVFLFRRK